MRLRVNPTMLRGKWWRLSPISDPTPDLPNLALLLNLPSQACFMIYFPFLFISSNVETDETFVPPLLTCIYMPQRIEIFQYTEMQLDVTAGIIPVFF